jgi:fimbrial isopeptide formation D2 family protein/uncharacterized repeat protein (TIGR01451 family)
MKKPELLIEKSSDQEVYAKHSIGTYRLKVTQTVAGLTAHQVTISDQFEKKGMTISGIRVRYNGKDITDSCDIKEGEDGRKFDISTGKDLGDKDQILVEYKVLFDQMISGEIVNTAIADADDADPSDTQNQVTMKEILPALSISKTSDKTTYEVGDTGIYQLKVTETVQGAVAENVVITDEIKEKGVKLLKDSLKVTGPDKKDLTAQCNIRQKIRAL